MSNLQIATYSFTPEASVGLIGNAGVVEVVAAGLLGGVVGVAAGVVVAVVAGVLAAVEVLAGAVVAVEPPIVELPLLPQAARNAEHNSATASSAIRLPIIDSPWFVKALADGC